MLQGSSSVASGPMPGATRPRLASAGKASAVPVQPRRCRADPPLLAGADQGGHLQQLTGVVQALVLPRLGLADLQSFGQACAATRAIVRGLPGAQLQQLAQVRPWCAPGAVRMAPSDAAGRAHRHSGCR